MEHHLQSLQDGENVENCIDICCIPFLCINDNTRNRFTQRVPLQIWTVCRIQSVYYDTFQLHLHPHKDVQQSYAAPWLTKQTNKRKVRNMLNDLKPTLVSVPMLILGTHVLFASIPNTIFLVFTDKCQMTHTLIHVKFLLSALGQVTDAALYVFSQREIREKISRIFHRSRERRVQLCHQKAEDLAPVSVSQEDFPIKSEHQECIGISPLRMNPTILVVTEAIEMQEL